MLNKPSPVKNCGDLQYLNLAQLRTGTCTQQRTFISPRCGVVQLLGGRNPAKEISKVSVAIWEFFNRKFSKRKSRVPAETKKKCYQQDLYCPTCPWYSDAVTLGALFKEISPLLFHSFLPKKTKQKTKTFKSGTKPGDWLCVL